MKAFIVILSTLVGLTNLNAQDYTWIKGSNQLDQTGTYGTMGAANPGNNPGGRADAARWRDAAGNLWLFGGFGYDQNGAQDILNDLWKYNPSTNEWTWVNGSNSINQTGVYGTLGVSSSSNSPGARSYAASWTDASGNLWMMGGLGVSTTTNVGYLNDLWKYSPSNNQWTWMGGSNGTNQNGVYGIQNISSPQNVPGGRLEAATWTDASGNLWLMGGVGFDHISTTADYLNDLWRYSPGNNQWTWVSGSNSADQMGAYGSLGVPSGTNIPGARRAFQGVTDASGNVWVYGGWGNDAYSTTKGTLNDLWWYSPTTNSWSWVKGANTIDQNGTYGLQGSFNSANLPGGREGFNMWLDNNGDIWIFGGFGMDSNFPYPNQLNDLWKFSISNNQWAWMKGGSGLMQSGTYGTQGVASNVNTPGARKSSASWIDAVGNLWLFGGTGYHSSNFGLFNDLWKFGFCNAAPVTISSTNTVVCAGRNVTLSVSGASSYTWSNGQTSNTISLTPSVTSIYTVQTIDASGCKNYASFTQSVTAVPSLSVSASKTTICAGESLTLTVSGATSYSWHTGGANTQSTLIVKPTSKTIYTVTGSSIANCSSSTSFTVSVNICAGIEDGSIISEIRLFPNPSHGVFTLSCPDSEYSADKLVLLNAIGQIVYEEEVQKSETTFSPQLGQGLYICQLLRKGEKIYTTRLIFN